MDRRTGLAIVAVAIAISSWAIASKAPPNDTAEALLSDLPGHFMDIHTEGPCSSSVGMNIPVAYVQLRSHSQSEAALYARSATWPMMPQRLLPPEGDDHAQQESPQASAVGGVRTMSVPLPLDEQSEAWADLVRGFETTTGGRCVLLRVDQSLGAGDVYSIGMAMQSLPNTQVLIFPELALE